MTTQKSILASKKRKYGYVYHFIFTRPTDGREFHYVGQHVGEKVDQRYFGSGFRLRQLYKKYGRPGNVLRTGIMWCYSRHELNFAEIVFIAEATKLYGRDCINLNYGGEGGRKSKVSVAKQRKSLSEFFATPKGHALRERNRILQSNRILSDETKLKISLAGTGKKRSDETRAKIGDIHRGRKRTQQARDNMVESWSKRAVVSCPHCPMTGVLNAMMRWHFDHCKVLTGISRMTEETKTRITETKRANPKLCPHCGLTGVGGNMVRFHFDNCKKAGWLL